MTSETNGDASAQHRKKPTNAESREAMAQAGDVEGLWRVISETSWTILDLEKDFRLLLRAIENAARSAPDHFAADLFTRMLSFSGYLLFRSHYYARTLISGYDRSMIGRGFHYLPSEVAETLLPRLVELQQHMGELAQMQAHTARLWELAREKRLKNDRAEGRRPAWNVTNGPGKPVRTDKKVSPPDSGEANSETTASANREGEGDFGQKPYQN